jgi:hypothetical protein
MQSLGGKPLVREPLVYGSDELLRRPGRRDLEHRPCRRADPKTLVALRLALIDGSNPMYARVVAEKGALAAGEQSGLLAGPGRQLTANNGVNAVEHGLQAAALHPVRDRPSRATELEQLLVSHDRALPTGKCRYRSVPPLGHKSALERALLPSARARPISGAEPAFAVSRRPSAQL